ncbi:MAG: hypothetical protein AAFZ58_13775 [Pseudomonadota bacterium]
MQKKTDDFCLTLVSEAGRGWPGDIDDRVLCQCAEVVAATPQAHLIDPSILSACDLPDFDEPDE